MEAGTVFAHVVLVFLLTTIIYVFIENRNNIKLPTLENQLQKESKHHFFISLVISVVLVIIFILIKSL